MLIVSEGSFGLITTVCEGLYDVLLVVGLDFTPQTFHTTFSSGQSQQRPCFDIAIIDDQTRENNEVFQVILTSTDTDVNFSNNTAAVIINDNDCKNNITCRI